MPFKKTSNTDRGQALVETALILGLLLFIIFVMIEAARLFQANLTVQNAAREAGRYAITGSYDSSCLPGCSNPRVASIKQVAEEKLTGLQIDPDAGFDDPQYYLIEVFSVDENQNFIQDSAGGPGDPVMVRVTYRVGILTPMVNAIARTVRVTGQVVFNNEQFDQYSGTSSQDEAPEIPVPPTVGPSPTPRPPDLTLEKSDNLDPAIVNETLEYTFVVQNLGDVNATNVTVTDTLPAGLNIVNPGPCSNAAGSLECNIGELTAGSSTSFAIQVEPQPSIIGTTITNIAGVFADQGDPDPTSNTDSETTEIVDTPTTADLEVRKSASGGPADLVAVDDTLSYYVTVINHGLAAATDVVVVDNLPDSVIYDGDFTSTDAGDTCTHAGADGDGRGGTITCQLGGLPRNGSATLTINVRPQVEDTITNSATVSSSTPEKSPDVYPNTDTVDVTVENAADLSVSKSLSPDPGRGEVLTYTVTVFNNGPADATGVTFQDSLPAQNEVTFAGYATAADGDRCTESGKVVTCDIGDLADGASDTVRLLVRADLEGTITNLVGVDGDQRDPHSANDSYSLTREIRPRADLAIEQISDSPDPVESGNYLNYQITVRNNGSSDATNVVVQNPLPADTIFVSASSPQGICGEEAGLISCNLGELAANDAAIVNVRMIPIQTSDGSIVNQAYVRGNEPDPDPSNNLDIETTSVSAFTFITVDPICGPAGATVTVRGYNWTPSANTDLQIFWNGDTANPLYDQKEQVFTDWEKDVVIPINAGWRQEHTISALIGSVWESAIFEVPCPAPDLEVLGPPTVITGTGTLTETEIKAGDDVTFTVAITNSGNRDAISQFFVGFYINPVIASSTHISQEYRVDLQAISGLAVGKGQVLSFTIPAAFGTPGIHDVYAVVDSDPDPGGTIPELDEENNLSAVLQVTVAESDNPTPVPEETPDPTATPESTGDLSGAAFAPAPGDTYIEQAGVAITIMDPEGTVIGTTTTDNRGLYFFTDLAPRSDPGYTMTACIEIDGISYADSATDVEVLPDPASNGWDFFLVEGLPCP